MFFDNNLTPGGYAWLFPEGDDKIRVGLGTYCSAHQLSQAKRRLSKFLNSHTELFGTVIKTIGGIAPLVKPFRKTIKDNILLVGDAAGHIRRYKVKQVLDKWTNKDRDRIFGVLKDFEPRSSDPEKQFKGLIWHVLFKEPLLFKDIALGLAHRVK